MRFRLRILMYALVVCGVLGALGAVMLTTFAEEVFNWLHR
jgi:hypothetical protein